MYAETISDRPALNRETAPNAATGVDWTKPPSRFLDVGHSELAYRRVGSGPDVLLVHGWPVHMATWRGVVAHLSEDYTCHLLDLPGAGFSRCHDIHRIGLGAHVDTLREALAQLELGRFAVVAHDSGAAIARHVIADDERVTGLVMGNTEIPGHFPPLLALYIAIAKIPGGPRMFKTLMRSRTFRRSSLAFGTCFADLDQIDGPFHDMVTRPMLESPKRLRETMQLLNTLDIDVIKNLGRIHRKIQAPVQLIWGADDPFFPLDKARRMVDDFPAGGDITVLDPGKLFVHEERPADFATATATFLADCFAR
jgi:pimeloyl-ACP methyl ester carboxylesterase